MKKMLLITLAGFFILNHANAQRKAYESKIGLGLDAALPVGDFKNTADYAIGISLLYQKPVSENLSITGNAGYLRFHGPAVFSNIKYRQGFVPIKAGARYLITKNVYGSGELGVAISTAGGSGTGTSFAYAPAIGTAFPVGKTGSVDIGLRYESWLAGNGTLSFAGIRAGYNF